MNNRGHPPPPSNPFSNLSGPWSTYVPASHSAYSPPPRFPYSVAGLRSSHGYSPGSGVYRGPSSYERHATSPPRVFRTHENDYASPERYSRLPTTTTAAATTPPKPYRRRLTDDDLPIDSDPVVVNAGFSFRMGKENSVVHKHVDIQPAHAIPEAASSGLTRQIDKFLKKSDHTLDRFHRVIQSRSGGRVGGQRGKSMTPGGGGGREESPEPSTLGLSLRSQRSTSAASIAVKAEKHLESLNRMKNGGGGGSKKAAPIAEHEEDHLDDLSSSDSSLDGFDTDDDVPRSADVFDISDDTSADLSKLSAIEVDPTTNCSTPFDPSRLDDLSSDSDDEYFDVVPLPGLRPQLPPTQLSTSPLPEQHPKPSQQNALQEPPRLPPTHSQSLPSVNKSIAQSRMGNAQAQPSNAATDSKQPAVQGTEGATSHSTKTTADLANAINTRAPPSSSASKADNKPNVHKAVKESNVLGKEKLPETGPTSKAKITAKSENKPDQNSEVKAGNASIAESSPKVSKEDNKTVSTAGTVQKAEIESKQKDNSQPNIESTVKTETSSEIKNQNMVGKPHKDAEKPSKENAPESKKIPEIDSKFSSEDKHSEPKASETKSSPVSDKASEVKNSSKPDKLPEAEITNKIDNTGVTKAESKPGENSVVVSSTSKVQNSSDSPQKESNPEVADVPNTEKSSTSATKSQNKDKLEEQNTPEVKNKSNTEPKVEKTPEAKNVDSANKAKPAPKSNIPGTALEENPTPSSKLSGEASKEVSDSKPLVSHEQPVVTDDELKSKKDISPQKDPLKLATAVSTTSTQKDQPVKPADSSLSGAKSKLLAQEHDVSVKSKQTTKETDTAPKKTDGVQSGKTDTGKADTKLEKANAAESDSTLEKLEVVKSDTKLGKAGDANSDVPSKDSQQSNADIPSSSSTKDPSSSVPENKKSVEDTASKDTSISDAAASKDLSANKETIETVKSTEIKEKASKKITTQDATKQVAQPSAINRKVRAGSPVPDKSAVVGIKISAPVITGKLQITPNSGPGPPESSKESSDGKIEESSSVASKSVSPKQVTDTESKITKDSSGLAVKKEKVVSDSSEQKSSTAEKSSLKKVTKEPNSNEAKGMPIANGILNNADVVNVSKADTQANPQPTKSVQNKQQSDKPSKTSKVENGDVSKDDDLCNDDISEAETYVDMSSRRSSVASDISRVSPDVSLRTGAKRTKSEKLAAMMNLWENDDVSQMSERSKPKAPASTPKVGKISGLKNMFEAGKTGDKLDPVNNPNLAKLKSPSSSAIAEPKKTVAGAAGITSFNAAKFGGTSKFKKPTEVSAKQGENVLKREKSTLSSKDVKGNITNKDTKENVVKKESESTKKDQNNIVNDKKSEKDREGNDKKSEKDKESNDKKPEKDKENNDKKSENNKESNDIKSEKGKESNDTSKIKADVDKVEKVVGKEKEQKGKSSGDNAVSIKDEANKDKDKDKVAPKVENKQEVITNGTVVGAENSVSGGSEGKELKKKKKKKKEKSEEAPGENKTDSKEKVVGEETKVKPDSNIKTEATNRECKDNLQSPAVTDNKAESKEKIIGEDSKIKLDGDSKAEVVNKEHIDKLENKTSEKSNNAVVPQNGSEIASSPNEAKETPVAVESSDIKTNVDKKQTLPEENIQSGVDTKVNLLEENVKSDTDKTKNNNLSTNVADATKLQDEKNDVNGSENKTRSGKKLGGIKSFIETVAKGGKTLEDKLSKTGLHVGKKSAKLDTQKNSPTFELKIKKNIEQGITPDTTVPDKAASVQDSAVKESTVITSPEDLGDTKAERKQTLAKAIPALESEVEALIKEASVLLKPEETPQSASYLPSKLTLPTKEILSVASFPDTPMGSALNITSLPASPTENKDFLPGDQRKTVLSLPSSPTKEVQFHFDENQKTPTSDECDDEVFVDAIDPAQLDTLMPLPDVQGDRERRSRSRTPMDIRERSVTPSPVIAQTEAILSETDRLLRRSRSNKSLRRSYSRSLSNAALNKLSEVTADLSEEHTTAHLAGERLEAEQAERMKLEKEIDRLQTDVKRMTSENGKLEMEKLALRSEVLSAAELNGDIDDDEAADASLYKRKYEWCLREMELLKKQLKQQQEDDLDQLLLLKKQLEKKVADAYEETDEQRQIVAQLKRKCQRLQAEMNDLKILLEEQTSRNNLLEKKQRKFDQEVMSVQEELRHERANKDKIQRERDQILSEKYSFEQEVTTLKLELELKEEKVSALNRELDDLTSSGKVEEEVATLKKAKHDLELRIKDQEEELDDLAGQVQMLEGAKVRLEMSMEQTRKEHRREVSQREEELEEVRISAQKKIKSLEAQLENEHEERTLLVREKHELERRIADLQDRTITHVDEDYVHKLKKELKKTKALLRDTQTMLEKAQSEGSHKLILRQLKTQLEDAEFAKTAAIKARQCAEADLSDISGQLDEVMRSKKEAEDKCARVSKEKAEIQTQLEESEEEVAEVMKKYKAVVSQLSVDQITLSEQSQQIAELEHSKQMLQERMLELSSKVEVLEGETANIHTQRRLEMKIKEMESKLELELTTRQRLESQIGRLKDQIERLSSELDAARVKEAQALDQSKRLGRQLRDAKEDLSNVQQRHTEASNKKSELEKQLELADSEVVTLKSDLKLAFKRIEDLQQAIQGDISDSDSDLSDSDSDSDGSLSSYLTASLRHQRSSSNSTLRTPPSEVQQLERMELPNSPCSEAMSAISEDVDDASTKESFA